MPTPLSTKQRAAASGGKRRRPHSLTEPPSGAPCAASLEPEERPTVDEACWRSWRNAAEASAVPAAPWRELSTLGLPARPARVSSTSPALPGGGLKAGADAEAGPARPHLG